MDEQYILTQYNQRDISMHSKEYENIDPKSLSQPEFGITMIRRVQQITTRSYIRPFISFALLFIE